MSITLSVTVQGICMFVVGDVGAEVWIIEDSQHTLSLNAGGANVSLSGRVVVFGTNSPVNGSQELPAAPVELGGYYIGYLADMRQVAPGGHLTKGWQLGDRTLPAGMATRIILNGGSISPNEQGTVGGQKIWCIGPKIQQCLTSESVFQCVVDDNPFVRIIDPANAAHPTDITLVPDSSNKSSITLGAYNTSKVGTLDLEHGVAFVTEFSAFDKAVTMNSGLLPVPYTYWPDYKKQTDPQGGPCPQALIDLRSLASALLGLNLNLVRAF